MSNRVHPSSLAAVDIGRDDASIANDDRVADSDADDDVFENVKEHFEEMDERIKILMNGTQHLKMLTVMASINVVLLAVGLASENLLTATNSVHDGNSDTGSVGFWTATVGNKEYALCDEWPEDDSVCGSLKAARAFFILSTLALSFGIITGLVRWIHEAIDEREPGEARRFDEWSNKQLYAILVSATLGMIGYIIYMGNCDKELARQLKNAVMGQADKPVCELPLLEYVGTGHRTDVLSCPEGSIYYYGTLGYSYALLAWSWIFPLWLILVKILLPMLEFDRDKEMMEDIEDDGKVNQSTA